MPKKSRRDRKHAPQQAAAKVTSPAAPPSDSSEIPGMQFTDFAALDATAAQSDLHGTVQPRQDSPENPSNNQDIAQMPSNQPPAGEQQGARTLRRVQRKDVAANSGAGLKTSQIAAVSLPPDSAAIPLAQVPYVPSDLRRVAFSALIIVIVIIAGGILITNAIH